MEVKLEMKEVTEMGGNGSRWNPTKEQIEILESVYSAGVKTPSAEQIQQITARLTEYGNIEGKNVFYWFQNTKARRRQKQKQDRLALLPRFYPPFHFPPPIIPNVSYYYPYEQVEAMKWIPIEKKTLELFPLKPGGSKSGDSSGSNVSDCSEERNIDEDSACKGGGLIDFLSGNGSSVTQETD